MMLAVLVVAVVLAIVVLLQEPLERLGARLGGEAPTERSPRERRASLRGLHPRSWDLAGRAEQRRLRSLPVLPAEDRAPRGAGAPPSSPRAFALEPRRGQDEIALHLALHALQQRRPSEDGTPDVPAPRVPQPRSATPRPAAADETRAASRRGARSGTREDA